MTSSEDRRITVVIRPTGGADSFLKVEDAMEQVLDFLRITEAAKTSLGKPHEDFEWRLHSASTNSPFTLVASAEPVNPTVDISEHVIAVKAETSRALDQVKNGRPPPGWFNEEAEQSLRNFFRRGANGIESTRIEFEETSVIEIDSSAAESVVERLEYVAQTIDVPARTAHGEIDGRLIAVGRYRNKPALYIKTALYGDTWCVLSDKLVDHWGDETKISSVWKGKRLIVFGRLIYWKGGKLSRVEAENVRTREVPKIDIESLLDPDFTAGLDPVAYLNKLHEGELG